MSVIVPEDLPGIEHANAELDRLMAADESMERGAGSGENESVKQDGQRAGQQGTETTQADTPAAAAEKQKAESRELKAGSGEQGAKAEAEKQKAESREQGAKEQKPEPSRYEKSRERQERSWKELNDQKDALKRDREEFDRAKAEHEQRVAQAENEFSPDQYEAAADKFEKDGKYELAEAARERAEKLRKNPPASKQGQDAATREWTLKAGIDFPELAKANSSTQLRVAQLLKEEPELKSHPKGIYMAARLASLEGEISTAKATAASVSAKDKEIEKLQAKIKELEEATAPGHGGAAAMPRGAKSFEELNDTEQLAELERYARETGTLR